MDPSRLPMSPNMSRGNPRQIQIERKDNGFGFTLRHFIVYPPEEGCDNGPPITEPMDTIFVKSVKEMGPAVKAGLNIGDRIVSVNGETVSGRSYAQVVQLIQKSRDTLFLVVVPREDDILQVYFSEIAQNPESNRRDGSQPPLGSKPHWPGASVCSSSSRESSPFSSKTSDSTRDSVYGHNRDYPRHSRDVPHLQHDAGEGVPRQFASQSIYGSLSRPPEPHWTQQIQDDKLLQVPEAEHVYAVVGGNEPFWGATSSNNSSSSNTLGSGSTWPNTSQGTWPGPANSNNSRESLDSDNSAAAGFNSRPDESLISKIKKDCEMKEEFLKNQTYPAYLSSPPKEVDTSPYGIANLSSTMPPSRVEIIRNASPPRKENTPVADGSGIAVQTPAAPVYSARRRSSSRGRQASSKRGSVSFAIEKINARTSPEQEKKTSKAEVFPIPPPPRPLKKAFDMGKRSELSPDRMRKLSDEAILDGEPALGAAGMLPRSSIISSVPIPKAVETEENRKKMEDEKTFSVSLYVNENEKNKIVDMLHRAKSLISRKVEKVMGKKPKPNSISNVDAMQMVLEQFVEHEEREERRQREEEEKLIMEQGLQVEIRRSLGQDAPVEFPPVPSVSVEEQADEVMQINEDMEVSRLTSHHLLKPPSRRRLFSPQQSPTCLSPTRSLSPADHVPCPFGNRPDSELYPARLRRPSSLYGAGAAAASSRPPSRSVSVSPSFPMQEEMQEEIVETVEEIVEKEEEEKGEACEEEEEEWEYEDAEEDDQLIRCCRPDSFVIPIGGVWNPSEEVDTSAGPSWGKVEETTGPSWGKVEETGNSWGKVEAASNRWGKVEETENNWVEGAENSWGKLEDAWENKEASKQEAVVTTHSEETVEAVEEKTEGYQRGRGNNWGGSYDNSYDDAFSRNNFVIVGSRTLHCEPPQVYQPTIPRPPVCVGCYSGNAGGTYCGGCHYHAPVCPLCVVAPPIAPCCNMMTMTTPYQPRPPRPSNLPGIQPLQTYGYRGRHEGPTLPHHGHGGTHGPLPHHGHGGHHTHHDGMVASSHMHHGRGYAPHAHRALPPLVTTPVQMHPDPLRTGHKLDPVSVSAIPMGPHPDRETHSKQVVMRKKAFRQDNEEERNLRRISYLQATKEDPMDVEDNLTGDSGLAPTHSIKKLKSIFSEKASENQPPSLPPPPSPRARELKPTEHSPAPPSAPHTVPDGTMEGYLTCKVAVVDGKKAIDRSWKTVYVILKQSVLYMYKDKKLALANPDDTEEKPVKLNETEVAVADDYTKRKNVFRVKTEGLSEYLFQAEDEELMKNWVQAIDAAAMAVIVDERKDANKLRKLTSFRNRSPTGQSPSNKSRKSSTDTIPPFKDKDKKNWKGKVVKQLKKMGGGSHGPLYPEGGSVGVPLEECPLCPASLDSESDNIPYLVKICCDIVNERGLDIIGIYRVPGNNAAVTYLTDLINKGQEHFQLDDHRWQDVNVVSSLLKSFFRKLPDPLFTMEMYSLFIDASKLEQPAKRLDLLRKLIRDLPEINYETLKYLCAHLCNVVEHSSVNKMEIRNLAIVFGPTLVRTSDDNMVSMVTDMSQQCRIIESILSNNDFFFNDIDEAVINDEEEENNLITGVGNQSLMLANLAKLEDAGKVQSPKNDMSTKDIVTSIISAANRKMLRSAAGSKGKKESLTDYDRSEDSRASESRRDSESVLHGALQIASAVPGLIGPMATSEGNSGRDTPDIDFRQFYGRQSSRGSISGDLMGMGNLGKRRGSLPVCQSKRGSICEYSGGAMCESTPVGELCETRMAIMQVATHEVSTQLEDSFTNGDESEDNQEVVTTGKLSLNVSGVVQNTVSTTCAHGPRHSTHDHDDTQTTAKNYTHQDDTRGKNDTHQDDTQTSAKNDTQQDDTQTNGKTSKFPIETYAGLDAATAERIKKFEAETKAMLTRPVAVGSSFSRSTQELSEHSFQESSTGSTSLRSSTLSARMSGLRGSPLTTSSLASLPRASNSSTSLPRASNSVTSLPKASSSVTSLPKSSSSANNSVANLPRSRHSLASNSTASLPRASSVSSSSSVRASISSVGSLEPLQPSDHSKIRASISSVGSLEPLQSNDHTKIRASISSAGSLEQPFDFTKLRQEPVQPTQPADPSKCRLTTPDPDPGPLDGGILLQEPYPSDQLYPAMPPERRFLSLSYRTSLPNLPVGPVHCPVACAARRPSLERPDPSADFDTKKIMSNGTLMRLKQRRPDLLMEGGGGTVETIFDCGEERELEHMEDTCSTEKLLSNLTVSFDQKMRLLLDPNYQSSSSSSSPSASRSIQQMVQLSHSSSSSPAAGRSIQQLVQHSSSSSSSSPATSRSLQQVTQQPASSCSSPVSPVRYPPVPNSAAASHSASPASASLNSSPSRQVLPPDSFPHPLASLSAARNLPASLESQQAKMSPENKKELDEARNIAQQVRQSSKKVELRRGGRVDKHTEPVLRQVNCRKERVRRSDSLTKKEKTELNQIKKRDGGEKENKVAKLRDHFERGSGVKAKSTKIDVNKLRKKLSERNNRRIKRRHTVGGTKDFGDGVVNGGRRNGHTAWDRLQPLVTDEELNVDRSLGVWLKRNRPASRRLSLPDSAAVSAALKLPKHMESHV